MAALAKKQVVQDKAQIRLARAVVGQGDASRALWLRGFQVLQQGLDETEQVVHLFEFAARVLVEPPVAREDVQFFE